jgi:hypothetical protein
MKRLLYLLFIFVSFSTQAQTVNDLGFKLNLYGKTNRSPFLFVHFDKNVYSINENAWFTAYLFNADYRQYKILSVALVKDVDRVVVMADKFMMGKGVCFGNTIIPDSIAPGNYTFLLTTNRLVNGRPEMVFAQPVTIKTQSDPVFTASLNPLDTAGSNTEQKVMLLVDVPEHNPNKKIPPPQIDFKYYVGSSAHPLIHGEAKTEKQYNFTIPSRLLVPGNNLLHVQLSYKRETRDISMELPARPGPALVRFFPEGGNLVNDLPGTVGLEVRTAAGAPLGTSAFLYDNDKLTDTLQTNSYGLGRFTLIPKAGHSYSLKLYKVNQKDTSYRLPEPLASGPAITISNAVVNDTLIVTIKDNRQEKLYLTGHNYQQLFFTQAVSMTKGTKRIKLIIKDIPKGLTELTLTDSLGRPFAERLFFAHYNQREPLVVTTDKKEYATRQMVNVKLKLDASLPDSALVSMACVQENRLSLNKKTDIESYFYLKHDLGELPVRDSYLQNTGTDKNFLENILLIKGWSRYKWTDILRSQPQDTIKQSTYLVFTGTVNWVGDPPKNFKGDWLGEPVRKSVTIVNLDQPLNMITTSKAGTFTLADSTILTLPGKLVNQIVAGKGSDNYKILIRDPYTPLNKVLAAQSIPEDHETRSQANSNYLEIPENEHAHHLKEVTINGNDDGDDLFNRHGPNACGDYVCVSHILNCPNHRNSPANVPPKVGEMYYSSLGIHPTTITYQGCTVPDGKSFWFKGIYFTQEFYPADYSKDTTGVSDYQSTIYWNYCIKVSSLKAAELSFPTSDIAGRYKIVVQGITNSDITYGEAVFNVVKGK